MTNDDANDITAPQTIESMTQAARDLERCGPRQRELAAAALIAGPGSTAWQDAEAALAEIAH